MKVTKNLAEYIKNMGINLSELSRKADIPYHTLYKCLGAELPQRELRADELASICMVLNLNPMDFWSRKAA